MTGKGRTFLPFVRLPSLTALCATKGTAMSRYLPTITDTITATLRTSYGWNLVTDLATHAVRALGIARTLLVRFMGVAPASWQVVAVRRLQPAVDRAARAHRLHCSQAMWQRWSLRPVKPGPGAKSGTF
jgi:hypothetical protein